MVIKIIVNLAEVNMCDFVIEVFAEIADFFIDLWSDKLINKFASKKKKQANSDLHK